MICGPKKQCIPLKTTFFRAQSFSIRKTRINKSRLPSCLCPKPYYTDDKTHTVIKVIENTRICPLYRSTQRVTCTFVPTQCVCMCWFYQININQSRLCGMNHLVQETSNYPIRCPFPASANLIQIKPDQSLFIFNNRGHVIKLFRVFGFILHVHFFLVKAIVWPKPLDHTYIIKLITVIHGYVFCFHFYP